MRAPSPALDHAPLPCPPWQTPALARLIEYWCLKLVLECRAITSDEKRDPSDLAAALCKALGVSSYAPADSMETLLQHLQGRQAELMQQAIPAPESCFPLIQRLGDLLGLNQGELRLLALVCIRDLKPEFAAFLAQRENACPGIPLRGLLAHLAGLPSHLGSRILGYAAPLVRMGIVEGEDDSPFRLRQQHCVDARLIDLLYSGAEAPEEYLRCHFSALPPSALSLSDFSHVGEALQGWIAVLRHGLRTGQSGLNVLIHGRPGLGKSELVRVLAAAIEAELIQVAGKGASGLPQSRTGILGAIHVVQRMLRRQQPTLLLVDEADALLPKGDDMEAMVEINSGNGARPASLKAWIVELMEHNRLPMVWVANDVSEVHPAFLRRFQLVLEMRTPPRSQRRRMIDAALGASPVSDALRDRLAAIDDLAIGNVVNLSRTAQALSGSGLPVEDFLQEQLRQQRALQGLGPLPASEYGPLGPVVLDWLNPSEPLKPLLEIASRSGGLRLCAHGRPGTGKTAFAHALADALDRPLRELSAAHLLSPWVGRTERLIAHAFAEAEASGAALLIDEVESLLQNRSSLERNWELSQVNALLAAIDRHAGVLVLTTNHPERIDPALRRRIDATVEFAALGPEQLERIWSSLGLRFGWGQEGAALASSVSRLSEVCLGDLSAVVRRLGALGEMPSAFEVYSALRRGRERSNALTLTHRA